MSEIIQPLWETKEHKKIAKENVKEIKDLDDLNLFEEGSFENGEIKDEEDEDTEAKKSSEDWEDLISGFEEGNEN